MGHSRGFPPVRPGAAPPGRLPRARPGRTRPGQRIDDGAARRVDRGCPAPKVTVRNQTRVIRVDFDPESSCRQATAKGNPTDISGVLYVAVFWFIHPGRAGAGVILLGRFATESGHVRFESGRRKVGRKRIRPTARWKRTKRITTSAAYRPVPVLFIALLNHHTITAIPIHHSVSSSKRREGCGSDT